MPISTARIASFDVLLRVERESAYAAELLHTEKVAKLEARDRNLAMQIVMGTLRWQSKLDDGLAGLLSGKNEIQKLDAEVRITLRMAAFQLRHLDRIPVSAAVNDSVDMVKRARKGSAAPLVNAVLRKFAATTLKPDVPLDSAEAIAHALAHPLWMVKRWVQQLGIDTTRRICEAGQALPLTSLRMPTGAKQAAAMETELREAGVELAMGQIMSHARRVVSGDMTATAAFREKRVSIQDEASQLVAALVGQGERILDCCAAPGGKTQAISARNPHAQIVAVELHAQRARMMQKMISAKNVEFVHGDIAGLKVEAPFDRVLADVPCSGTGTLARNPEIKWRLKPEDLADLQRRQKSILSAAVERAGANARIVYSTCSIEPEENEQVVKEILRERKDLRLVEVKQVLQALKRSGELAWNDFEKITIGPFLRTLPGVHPCDGFFAAVMEKISA